MCCRTSTRDQRLSDAREHEEIMSRFSVVKSTSTTFTKKMCVLHKLHPDTDQLEEEDFGSFFFLLFFLFLLPVARMVGLQLPLPLLGSAVGVADAHEHVQLRLDLGRLLLLLLLPLSLQHLGCEEGQGGRVHQLGRSASQDQHGQGQPTVDRAASHSRPLRRGNHRQRRRPQPT